VPWCCKKKWERAYKSVIQEEPKKKSDQDRVRGTKKAAVLTGDPDIPGLVAFNVYDTKPVHFFFYGLHWPQMD
jgi:hypothetical protein